jgi:hypothetical protein
MNGETSEPEEQKRLIISGRTNIEDLPGQMV